ncbi:PepSY domain-containing protein [Bradyrhizobium liaoningense]|uniref:PepSY-associated TM helix domain-containing protein n=1 Tax=Bradyrhizobium liaoningense TaxID=43992 RepID=UPI001BA8D400|nr:PepSY-associated TM helix domain-containing protein [Bradyrhizobium liaoningense]MBR0715733.1 PepSY domain-containing protein [Bradyrhizobium liaoningense]
MKARTVRIWSAVHTWTSLISSLFLFLLCLTGLPLIFHHEIDELLGYAPQPEVHAGEKATTQRIANSALAADPGRVLQYISWDKDEPGIVFAFTNSAPNGEPDKATVRAFDAVTTKVLGPVGVGPMLIVLKLHVDMFAGQPGKLFLGGMGLLFALAIVSGVVLYWPFTRRLRFATIRDSASRRVGWLDWHNLIGVVTIAWALVVGLTGVVNTWAELMLNQWKANELAVMVAPFAGKPPPTHLASLDVIVDRAKETAPGMDMAFIAFPGTPFTSSHHFAVFMRGDTPLTARLLKPVLLDGETGEVADSRALPVYLQALLISQPLHFGDYGGMPLKIIWAALDVLTMIVIGSGLYLWVAGRRKRAPAGPYGARAAVPS